MDDETILRRLAEIEGCGQSAKRLPGGMHRVVYRTKDWDEFDPLTNKAQAFELVEKYRAQVMPQYKDVWYWRCFVWAGEGWDRRMEFVDDERLPRAICLAVIASKEQ